MTTKVIQDARIRQLNNLEIRNGDYVLYCMQQSSRAEYNHALEYAILKANDLGQPLLVVFGLMDAAQIHLPTSPGSSACMTVPGRSARFSVKYAI